MAPNTEGGEKRENRFRETQGKGLTVSQDVLAYYRSRTEDSPRSSRTVSSGGEGLVGRVEQLTLSDTKKEHLSFRAMYLTGFFDSASCLSTGWLLDIHVRSEGTVYRCIVFMGVTVRAWPCAGFARRPVVCLTLRLICACNDPLIFKKKSGCRKPSRGLFRNGIYKEIARKCATRHRDIISLSGFVENINASASVRQ